MSEPPAEPGADGTLRTRVAGGLAIFLAAMLVLWVGLPLLAPAFVLLAVVALSEYAELMRLRGVPVRKRSLFVAAVLTVPASLPSTYPGMPTLAGGVSWREALLVTFVIYVLVLEVAVPNRNSVHAAAFTVAGYLYVPFLLGYVITLRYTPDGHLGLWFLGIPLLSAIATDVGAYTLGSLFGRTPLAPRVSPRKTVEGAVGGLLLALLIVAGIALLARRVAGLELGVGTVVALTVVTSLAAQLGDLFESLLKRWAGVKDAGVLLPGHGGVLDRLDSLLFTFPVSYLFVTMLVVPYAT
ncbi:MAG TPA: phosphatidate cytidylyltransferase [Trueperaceae bacterium]